MDTPCPCGSNVPFGRCCEPVVTGDISAPTAERLMRSRYTAYHRGDARHVLRTWHPDTRPVSLDLDDDREWTGLDVLAVTGGGMLHTSGTVDFVAHFRDRRRGRSGVGEMRENSRFERVSGVWMYVEEL